MNTEDPKEQREPAKLVELQPLDEAPLPSRHVGKSGEVIIGLGGDHGRPVPEQPPHICPECDYNLTGLVSRRCPECGTAFTLSEARQHAGVFSLVAERDRRSVRLDRITFYSGLVLLVAGMVTPMVIPWGGYGRIVALRFWMTVLTMLILAIAWVWKSKLDRPWSDGMVFAGLLSIGFAVAYLLT